MAGELIYAYAYMLGRVDISDAVSLLARYSSAPDRCHSLGLKCLCKYLRRNIEWGILYWRQAPCYLPVTSRPSLSTTKIYRFSEVLESPGACVLLRRVACHRPAHSSIGDWPILLPRRRCYRVQVELGLLPSWPTAELNNLTQNIMMASV